MRDESLQDPGAPGATDEEAVEAELVEDAPVAPEAAAVPGVDPVELGDEVTGAEEAVVNDGTAGGDGAEVPVEDEESTLRRELAERTEDLQRVTAEFTNYRRRADRDRTAGAAEAKARVLADLLPVADDLERARAHGDLGEGPLRAFADKLTAFLGSQGVQEYGAEGDAFEPALHEAVQDESTGGDPVVGTVLRKGYRLGERVLRTAMVVVR